MYHCGKISENAIYPFNNEDIKGIGRYKKIVNENEYIYDIVFDDNFNLKWSQNEIHEYINGKNGHYNEWSYDLNSQTMRNIVMNWINELDYKNRSKRNIIRHIMCKISSENSGDDGLIVGKWEGSYKIDGKSPFYWNSSHSIFEEREKTGKPVRYGQCWCFAETMTSICRFLNIPTRTISGKNTLIDENLDGGIDFKEDLRKSDTIDIKFSLLNKNDLANSFNNLINGFSDKGESWENLSIYECGDSFWNIHYWNEIYLDNEWEIIDSTPIYKSFSNDDYKNKKIGGPSKISSFNGIVNSLNYDFDRLFSMVNSPYRLWTTESIVEGNSIINIPFVYSIIYPLSEKMSVYIQSNKVKNVFKKVPIISTKNEVLTPNYTAPDDFLNSIYYKNAYFEGIFYIQTVFLDKIGNVLKVDRVNSTIDGFDKKIKHIPECYLISYLLIEKEYNNLPKWLTFCKYYKK